MIESSNFTDQGTGTLPLDPEFRRRGLGLMPDGDLRLVERLTRLNATTLLYSFTIDDPTIWRLPWTVEVPMTKTDEQLYGYACHEGNYGLGGILRGARAAKKSFEVVFCNERKDTAEPRREHGMASYVTTSRETPRKRATVNFLNGLPIK